jgi:ABC-2 type transport system permease protein
LSRYWRIYSVFFKSSIQKELEFRANFIAKVAMSCTWVLMTLVLISVIFSRTETIAGWNREQVFVLTSTVFFMEAIVRGFFMSLMDIPSMARLGTLDFVLTKPIDSQFWVSVRRFNLEQVGMIIVGAILLMVNISHTSAHVNLAGVLGYLILILCALVIFYSFAVSLMTLGIFFMRIDNMWVLCDMTLEIARYPIDIFAIGVRQALIYIIPLGFLSTIPTKQLLNGFDPGLVALGIVWAIVFFLASRAFWKFAARKYASASS